MPDMLTLSLSPTLELYFSGFGADYVSLFFRVEYAERFVGGRCAGALR